MKNILVVDDEQNILNALGRELKEYYELESFDSPVEALKRCHEKQFDLVISDYKMPEMSGLEFLKQLRQLQPDSSLMVLSGEVDINDLIRTINETHIFRFLAKPWVAKVLLSNIQQAMAYRDVILEYRQQADAYRGNHAVMQAERGGHLYHIVLVENDQHLLELMFRGLADESSHERLYGAIQYEVSKSVEGRQLKCVVHSFRTAKDALAYAAKNSCDLIISGQTLPDMDGIQLLSKMRKSQPDVALILNSSDPDKLELTQAINEAEVQSVLQLNWDSYEMHANIRHQAWNLYQLKMAVVQALVSRALLLENKRLAALR